MSLNIRNPETERLAAELAKETGESKTEAVTRALRDRLDRVRRERSRRSLADELQAIAEHFSRFPVLDTRAPDEILGYDDTGLPNSWLSIRPPFWRSCLAGLSNAVWWNRSRRRIPFGCRTQGSSNARS